jgi:pimeloyl-ACP methyl ester carboxylesterase
MEFLKLHPEKVSNLILIGALSAKADTIDGSSIFSKRYENQVDFLINRKEVKDLKAHYESRNGSDSSQVGYYNYKSYLTDKEQTELWRIEFASVNIYRMENWRLMKGGRAYYKNDAAMMAESVNWIYDYRQTLNNNGKVTIIMGDHDFLDFNAENHKKLLVNFPKVKVVTIKDAGHNIWTDDPITFKIELIKALTK